MHLLNIYQTPLRWTDLDAYGHLNNAVYFDFMSEARAELLKAFLLKEGMCQFVTAHVECDYKIPYHYPETLILKQFCTEMSKTSFSLRYEFYSASKPDALHASGFVKMVAYDPQKKRPTRIPEEIVALLAPTI